MKIDFGKATPNAATATAFAQMLGANKGPESAGDIRQLAVGSLHPYPNQPFHPYPGERLRELAEDIAQNGVLSPVIVRLLMDDEYQILAGHNRVAAAKLAGLDTVPAIIKDVDDETAMLIVVNTNLNQREKLLPSEKAFAYKMQLEAMKCQGKRRDLTSAPLVQKLNQCYSRDILATQAGESGEQIRRYIRLTELITPLLDMVDNEALPLRVGVMLSALPPDKQQMLFDFIDANELQHVSIAQAEVLTRSGNTLDEKKLYLVFFGLKERAARKAVSYQLPSDIVTSYFPGWEKKAVEDELIKILSEHFSRA